LVTASAAAAGHPHLPHHSLVGWLAAPTLLLGGGSKSGGTDFVGSDFGAHTTLRVAAESPDMTS
jgi:hypothetical protein